MKILLVSPLGFAIKPDTKYAGIEKLVWQYAQELSKEHEVSVLGHSDSVFPQEATNYGTKPFTKDVFLLSEIKQYQSYHYMIRQFDVIHDFSHQHFASRYNYKLPSLNLFWHAPAIAQYPKSPYNIIAPSVWAAREFRRIYKQEARYQQSIVIDPNEYYPKGERGDRFLTLGIMTPQKGNLAAVMLCKELGVPLDIAGGRGAERQGDLLTDYEQAIMRLCDGEQIIFHGEVTDKKKIELMQACKALLYITPDVYTEVTSHKIQEAMFCGAPVVTARAGAMPEIVTDKVDGYLCANEDEYKDAIKNIDKLSPENTHDAVVKKYSLGNVCAEYVKLYTEVKDGLSW